MTHLNFKEIWKDLKPVRVYFKRVLVSIDQFANTIAGGYPDETISSRAGKAAQDGHWPSCVLCKVLDIFDEDHCEKNIEEDEGKKSKLNK